MLFLGVFGCQNWPLFEHLPDPETEHAPVPREDLLEDPGLSADAVQALGNFSEPTLIVVEGSTTDCGFDAAAQGPLWPERPVDADGDGLAEEGRRAVGWYTGDLDRFSLTVDRTLRLAVELSWANPPSGGENAPYRPSEAAGAWSSESDLDVVVYEVAAEGAPSTLSHDEGASRRHPEQVAASIVLGAGETRTVGVACHHALASGYELRLRLSVP